MLRWTATADYHRLMGTARMLREILATPCFELSAADRATLAEEIRAIHEDARALRFGSSVEPHRQANDEHRLRLVGE